MPNTPKDPAATAPEALLISTDPYHVHTAGSQRHCRDFALACMVREGPSTKLHLYRFEESIEVETERARIISNIRERQRDLSAQSQALKERVVDYESRIEAGEIDCMLVRDQTELEIAKLDAAWRAYGDLLVDLRAI